MFKKNVDTSNREDMIQFLKRHFHNDFSFRNIYFTFI